MAFQQLLRDILAMATPTELLVKHALFKILGHDGVEGVAELMRDAGVDHGQMLVLVLLLITKHVS